MEFDRGLREHGPFLNRNSSPVGDYFDVKLDDFLSEPSSLVKMADSKPSTTAALTLDEECFVVMGRDVIDMFDLECDVCKDLFDVVKKPPKLLPCKHTLCSSCLSALKGKERQRQGVALTAKDSVGCPFCTETFSSATLLQNDHRVVKGLEIVKKSKAAFKNVCLKHNCKGLNRFCETCEVPVCSDCLKFLHDDEEGDHDIVDLTTAMKKMTDPLNDLERRCLTSIHQMEMKNEIIKCVKNRLAENEADAISKIEKQFDHYSTLMSARKESLIAMTKDKTRTRLSEIKLESQNLESSTATLQKLFNELTISRESDAVREIFKLRKQIIDNQDLLKVPPNEGLSKTFEFKAVNGGRLEEDIATVGDLQEKMDLKLECPTNNTFQASQGVFNFSAS